jgi:hypothetical protein
MLRLLWLFWWLLMIGGAIDNLLSYASMRDHYKEQGHIWPWRTHEIKLIVVFLPLDVLVYLYLAHYQLCSTIPPTQELPQQSLPT